MSTRKQTALLHGNLCPNAPYYTVQHMSRDRPTNLDLKMCIIARQDFGAGKASEKTELVCLDTVWWYPVC